MSANETKIIGSKTAEEVFGIGGAASIKLFEPTDNTPAATDHSFDLDMIILGIAWMYAGVGNNLMLIGPTGSGKSSFVDQFCARIGMSVYPVACHSRLEFGELMGGYCMVNENGVMNKKWVDGPAARAMKEGAVLLLEEGNFLDQGVLGGLNRLLDGMSYLVPETNETIKPHKHFRIATTSNPFGPQYKGTKKMNIAYLDRYLVGEIDYMPAPQECQVINRATKGLEGWTIDFIVKTANTVREQFKENNMETTISTRGLIRWARMIGMYSKSLHEAAKKDNRAKCCEILSCALGQSITNRSDPSEKQSIEAIIQKTFKL